MEDRTFTRREIIDAAAEGYGDAVLGTLVNDKGNVIKNADKVAGDTLMLYVAREIVELTEMDGNDWEDIAELRRAIRAAIDELEGVDDALLKLELAAEGVAGPLIVKATELQVGDLFNGVEVASVHERPHGLSVVVKFVDDSYNDFDRGDTFKIMRPHAL